MHNTAGVSVCETRKEHVATRVESKRCQSTPKLCIQKVRRRHPRAARRRVIDLGATLKGGILTDVTVLFGPSPKTAAVISANQIFARVSVHTGLSCTLICICEGRSKESVNWMKPEKGQDRKETSNPALKACWHLRSCIIEHSEVRVR